jgi:putative transposase
MGSLNRKSIRLKDYDYSQSGYYFITICVKDRQNILCDIVSIHGISKILTTQTGQTVLHYLQNIGSVYQKANLDCFVIMPNHVHCIIQLYDGLSLSVIINSFKTITSKKSGVTLWQRGYYDHIIRNEKELQKIREYIMNNPSKWQEDEYYT